MEVWDTLYMNGLLPSNASGDLSQPPVLINPLRRSSDTSTPVSATISTASNPGGLSSGPLTTSLTVPTPAVLTETTKFPIPNTTTLADSRLRSQSLSVDTLKQYTGSQFPKAALLQQAGSEGRSAMDVGDIAASMPDIHPSTHARASLIIDEQLVERTADKENLDVSFSDQNLMETSSTKLSPYKHVRSGSDPPFAPENRRRFRKLRLSVW